MREIRFDEIPKYSSWVSKLLNQHKIYYKNPMEVQREYNNEKWNDILQIIESTSNCNLSNLHNGIYNENEILGRSSEVGFFLQSAKQFYNDEIALYKKVLTKYLKKGDSIIELGAGYGAIILKLSEIFGADYQYLAGEYTDNGLEAMRRLAMNEKNKIITGKCDFFSLTKDECFKNAGGVLYTSYALMYINELSHNFVNYIKSIKPKYCIHFEPCYEHHAIDSLDGLLCRKYIEVNDYNRNLLTVLKKAEKQGEIEIIEENKNVFGNNALLPISIIVWRPLYAKSAY